MQITIKKVNLNNKNETHLFYEEKSLVGLTPVLQVVKFVLANFRNYFQNAKLYVSNSI
jgi:hypothetical protein